MIIMELFGCVEAEMYNYYLKRASKLEMAPVEPNEDIMMNAHPNAS